MTFSLPVTTYGQHITLRYCEFETSFPKMRNTATTKHGNSTGKTMRKTFTFTQGKQCPEPAKTL